MRFFVDSVADTPLHRALLFFALRLVPLAVGAKADDAGTGVAHRLLFLTLSPPLLGCQRQLGLFECGDGV